MTSGIGFVGAGLMGHGAAKHILAKGHPLTVIAHRNRAPIDDLIGRGAKEAATVAELTAAADVLFLCLPDAPTVDRVLHGDDGVLAGAHDGLIVVDMTTSQPEATVRFGAELAARGARLVDAPMTRSPLEAEEGRLNVLVGGDPETVGRVRPVLATFTENVWHVGPLGSGHRFKLVHNFMSIANMAVVLETTVAAARLGIDLERFFEIGSAGGANSVMFQKLMPGALRGDPSGLRAHASTALKDLRYYNAMADDAGLHSMMSKAAQQVFQLAAALGHGDTMIPLLFEPLAELNRVGRDAKGAAGDRQRSA